MALTINKLIKGALKLRKKEPKFKNLKIAKLRIVPQVNKESFFINTWVTGSTGSIQYKTSIMFEDITSERLNRGEKCLKGFMKIRSPKKKLYCVEKPTMSKTKVKVRCSCEDFFFTYAFWNKGKDGLYGGPLKPYKRKTTDRPERNPKHVPGMCKHLFKLVDELRVNKVIKP